MQVQVLLISLGKRINEKKNPKSLWKIKSPVIWPGFFLQTISVELFCLNGSSAFFAVSGYCIFSTALNDPSYFYC